MPNPLTISIVVPVYNIEKIQDHFDRCIESILTQTYPHTEIILVDDRSTDNTPAILQTLQSQNPTIRIITHAHNQGQGPARNTGVATASGDYTWFIDQDDTISPAACQIIADEAQRHDCPDIIRFNATSPSLKELDTKVCKASQMIRYDDYDKSKPQRLDIENTLLQLYQRSTTPWKQAIQSNLARSVQFPDFYPEDIVYVLGILARANHILFVDATLYCWHKHTLNESQTIDRQKDVQGHIKALQLMRETVQEFSHKRALSKFFLCHNAYWTMVCLTYFSRVMGCSEPAHRQWLHKICPNTWGAYGRLLWDYVLCSAHQLRCYFATSPTNSLPVFIYYPARIVQTQILVIKAILTLALLKLCPEFFCNGVRRYSLLSSRYKW